MALAVGSFAWLEDHAAALHLDESAFKVCLSGNRSMAKIHADQKEAERLDVKSTPTVFLGRMRADGGVELLRRINGALPVENFVAEIEKLVKRK